jgi:hypothetical protein
MDRFSSETLKVNVWANALNLIIENKTKRRLSKADRFKTLKQNIDIILNIFKTILSKI